MTDPTEHDAATYARRHAGELDASLTPAQRDLLGRVVARRIERGAKLELIARAASHALRELDAERARRLGRDEALRALAWEQLSTLRAHGETHVALSAATDACPICRAMAGIHPIGAVPAIPIASCTRPEGCRCLYRAPSDMPASALSDTAERAQLPEDGGATADPTAGASARPWYRPRTPRPHGPRWTEEERARRNRPRSFGGAPPRRGDSRPRRPRP
jgi:hypothetical protein